MWMPVSQQTLGDLICGACIFIRDPAPLSSEEEVEGYRYYKCAEGHEGRYSVGWRQEKERAEYERQREADMAACPYVECTCGHHEND